jgi:predicted HicB family RNase H-like nuclease
MEYKGYIGYVEFDDVAGILHGDVINIRDVITFQGKTVKEIQKTFEDSIEDYLEFCVKRGEKPDKPLTGKFVLHIPPELHREVCIQAKKSGKSLNSWITEQLSKAVRS